MIRNTFSILNGIGIKLEKRLWENGILTWSDFIDTQEIHFISSDKKAIFDSRLSSALKELENSNARYFASAIKRREHWRLFDTFKGEAVCLDIETSGLMPDKGGYVTVVGMYDGCDYRCFVRGNGLSSENLNKELSGYKYLITFYGAAFDIPFLFRSMPGLRVDMPHFDICFGSRKLGFQGGLKKLENTMGLERDEAVKGMDGYDAVKLWEYAKNGSSEALELLKLYNKEDTVNLFGIAEVIYQRLRAQTGIEEYLR
ncbi:MAG: ribonuclease H-like domain-containing protein [Thermodesulfovibrionales bacterium]|nr:ribonuclease H-like domain-containing protein [Thermodesulfovibrionales bacterium]